MGFRFRKSIKIGKSARINLSKSGIGYSIGTKGFRYTKKANGGTRTTTSIPGTGFSYVKETGARKSTPNYSTSTAHSATPADTAQPKKGGGCLSALWVFVLFIVLIGVCSPSEDTDDRNTPSTTPTIQTTPPVVIPDTLDEAFTAMRENASRTMESTTGRVDKIISIAKKDATAVDELVAEEAFEFIAQNYPEYYTDSATMEKIMYCGALLQYRYEGTGLEELGMDVVQAVKYVYRGAETVDDVATQENLSQIKEILTEAGIDLP